VGGKTLVPGLTPQQFGSYDYGFRAVISSFCRYFKGNCLNIGILPVQVLNLLKLFKAKELSERNYHLNKRLLTSNWHQRVF
jgi:3-isopropylmalate dehydratase small subunit